MKKAGMKRSLALLLAIVLCVGMLPMGALAAQPDASSEAAEEITPVHYYKFDEAAEDAAADDGTGSQAGTKTGTVGTVDGKAGKAAQLNGTGNVEVSDTTVLNGEAFTITAWVNWDGTGKVNTIVSNAYSGAVGSNGLLFYVKGANDGVDADGVLYAGDPVGTETGSAGKIKANEWTHVAFVKDGTTVTLYINGVADGGGSTSVTGTNTETLLIGGNHRTDAHNFHGALDEVKIFSQALTAAQIAQAMEIPGASEDVSYLETHKATVPDSGWQSASLNIPVHFAPGDSIASIKEGNEVLDAGSRYTVTDDNINLMSDFFKNYANATELVLTVTFTSGVEEIFTITRGNPTKRYGWSLQKGATGQDVEIPEGWITQTENGIIVNHSKMIVDSNHQEWVLYRADGDKLTDSVWEFDLTLTDPDSNQVGYINIAPAPRVTDGSNYEGFALDQPATLQRTGRKDGAEQYGGVTNEAGLTFEYGTTYHLRIVTEGSHMTVYVTVSGGEEQKLTEFDSPIGLGDSTYGFRIWRGGKTIKIENIKRTKLIKAGLDKETVQIDAADWGKNDVAVGVTYDSEAGDGIQSITQGDATLTAGEDYTVENGVLTLKKAYIEQQADTFSLNVAFIQGTNVTLWIIRHQTGVLQEYIWTPDQGASMWQQMSGNGTFEMNEDNTALHVKGKNLLINAKAPMVANGEIELTFQFLRDDKDSGLGALFRINQAENTWQTVLSQTSINGEPCWDFGKNGSYDRIIWDGYQWTSRESAKIKGTDIVKDIKLKARFYNDSITIWVDDQFCHTQGMTNATTAMGRMGLILGDYGDIMLKRAEFREVVSFEETESAAEDLTIAKDGLTVRLDGEFPRVIDYTLNGKKMNGAELSYHYATVNNVDYPATAEITAQSADSVTYHVTPDPTRTGVTFDVKFTVLDSQILEMLILNIDEPQDEMVFAIGLPQQPLISANSAQAGSTLDVSWIDKNARCYKDRSIDIPSKTVSTTAAMGVTLPIISNGELSASMFNNVLIGGDEFNYRAFKLENGEVSVGVWNTEFMYRGMDNEKMMPFPSEPDETELYCRVVITEDTNDDGIVNWQDGGNALKKLTNGIIPGGDQAARSFFHVGYNFSSGAQQPFLQVADNMKRLSNLLDGFSQQLIFKGYANEGHDSGHADFEDINKRAGGADDMNVAIAEAAKINSNFGIHINHHEAYPEAKMFNEHVITDRNAWHWMDQARLIRRYVDMLEGTFETRMNALFEQTPDLKFVYVDCWGEDRWGEKKLIGTMMKDGAEIFGNENAADFTRFGVWVHSTAGNNSAIHQFVYNSQKDIYLNNAIYWGGYNRAASMMSWQHNNNINGLVEQFYTNQLPQKYLMCHDVRRVADGVGYFEGNVTSGNYVITKDGNKLTDGSGKIFIPWYAEDSETKDPDEAAKIYHWNADGGETTWSLPSNWNDVETVYLYKTTQNGKVLVDTLTVTADHQVTIHADARTGYVLYPASASPDVTEWSVGSPIKDTMFNSRDFSIWQKDGEAEFAFNDDGNGVSILTISGAEAGQVSQVMTGLTVGQKYRVKVDAGAENGKTARITVKNGDETVSNYLEQVGMTNNYFDDYAKGKMVQRMWVDFTAQAETAEVILSADACESASGRVTFMQTRIVKTSEPDLPNGCVANETFEYVEQGAYGIFNPERSADGVPHLSETHLPYTSDTISGNWSLKLYGEYGQGNVTVRTSPATMRLEPNTGYVMEFETQGAGKVYVQSESDGRRVLEENFAVGKNTFDFTTDEKTDYVVRIENARVLDNFMVYFAEDLTPPTAPTNLVAAAVENDNAVTLSWEAATDDDGRIGGYCIYRDGELLATVGSLVTTYTDRDTEDETEYTYQVSAVNAGHTEGPKSNQATATTNVLLPEPTAARMIDGATITVTFNKAMEKASAETAENYTLTGVDGTRVVNAALSANGRTVTLTIAGMDVTSSVTLGIVNIKDASGKHTVAGDKSFVCSLMEHYFKLDEAAGQDAVDETGHMDGVKSSDVASVDGKDGKAASFNGGEYIDVDSDALYRTDTFTVTAWIKWDGRSGVNAIVGNDISGDGSSAGIIFFVDGGSGVLRTNSNLCAVVGSSDKPVTANEWHHVAFVKQTGSAQVYLDGELIGSDHVQFGIEKRVPFRIGGSHNSGGGLSYPFHGAIDEVKIFTAGLSAADIAVLAGMELAPTPAATFDAATMILSQVTDNMKYSVDNGRTWVDITGTSADLSEEEVTVANGIWVKQSGDGETTADSRIQVIALTQAPMPENVTKTDETTAGAKDGTILGVTSAMEYSADGGQTWITGTGEAITGLAPQDYLVRVKAEGTVLAGEILTITIRTYQSVTGVKLDKSDVSIKVGETASLTATVTPEDATEQGVIWSSDDENIATVDGNGLVTGVAEGTVTITVTTVDGGFTAACTVTVTAKIYTVTFDSQGGSTVDAQTVTEGGMAVKPDDPTRNGYTFGGWYTEAECTTEYDFDTPVTADIPLYAKWIAVDKNALTGAITAANAAKEGVVTSNKDAGEVEKGTKFVSEAEMKALNDAIADAQAVVNNADATQAEVDAAQNALEEAIATFREAEKTGTYVAPTEPAKPSAGTKPTQPSTTTETKENEDGSTTTIVTDNSTGTVTETTEKADGTVEVVETKADGTVTTTITDPEGAQTEKVTDADKNVTITVTDADGEELAKVELPAEVPASETRFDDVPEGHWADEAIHNAASLGLVNGVGDNKYDMTSSMTRGSLATILHRLSQGKTDYEVTFTDVAEDAFYAPGVAWAAKVGVVTGISEDVFAPDQVITREQLAVMLARYAKLLGVDTQADAAKVTAFSDGDKTGDWAVDGVAWCIEQGILQGKGDNVLDPTAEITRAEVAMMLDRFIALIK